MPCKLFIEVEPALRGWRLVRRLLTGRRDREVVLVCPSGAARERAVQLGVKAQACVVIPDGVESVVADTGARAALRARMGIQPTETLVVAVPPARRDTGTFTAVWAAMLLEKTRPDVRLLVPEAGPEAERARRLARSCRQSHVVRFVDRDLPPADAAAVGDLAIYLPVADAPVWGLARAMAAGRPIVASNVPAVREFLRHGHNAWLCRPDDPQAAARAMLEALERPEVSRTCAARAQELARQRFSRERFVSQYADLYGQLAPV